MLPPYRTPPSTLVLSPTALTSPLVLRAPGSSIPYVSAGHDLGDSGDGGYVLHQYGILHTSARVGGSEVRVQVSTGQRRGDSGVRRR
eukprot:2611322-Rhodomonas_salina.1